MEHIIGDGVYGKGCIWRFYSVEDAEMHDRESDSWRRAVDEMRLCLGKVWVDKNDPERKEWVIAGLEDNEPFCDYYWILEDEDHTVRYELVNSAGFYENIKK